jgi:hypothetical protein
MDHPVRVVLMAMEAGPEGVSGAYPEKNYMANRR